MDAPEILVQAHQVALGYGQQTVLAHLDFTIRAGEFWFCLGPNGVGKTTLMQAVLGGIRPRHGQLWLHPEIERRTHLGFVPQRCDLNPALPTTVREFTRLGTVGLRLSRREYQARLDWALASVGLRALSTQSYWSLSSGQRQRALVARALIRQPRVLLLDEPTNHLDLPTAEALLQLLVDLNRRDRLTFLFIAHDVAMAARYATHALLLHGGRGIAGQVDEVLTSQHLSRVYGVNLQVTRDAAGAVSVHHLTPEHI